jgi:hypothetical protein
VFARRLDVSTAAGRLRDTVDLFSAREALAIALQAVSELKGGVVRWMAVIGLFQLLPATMLKPTPEGPQDYAAWIGAMLASAWVGYMLNRAALRAIRGEDSGFWNARVGIGTFGAILMAVVVMVVPVTLGLILFVAPGVYLMLCWSQVTYLILDGRARHVDALRASEQLTRDRRFEIFLAVMVPFLLTLPARILEAVVPMGGSVATPGFVLFLVSTVWQMLALTYGVFVSAVVYQLLLNSRSARGSGTSFTA